MPTDQLVVRWWPPYSNGYKDQPCTHMREAELMRDWFQGQSVKASIVRLLITEQPVA